MEVQPVKNYVWADNLRVLATISVITQHLSANILSSFGTNISSDWWMASIFDGLTRFCVPMFLMLSGALLLHKEYRLKDFLGNKFSRIVLPFLFWSFIYIGFEINSRANNAHIPFYEVIKISLSMLRTGSSFHLWYIYVIIGIYLFLPILGKWIRNSTENEILYFIAVWLIVIFFNQPYIAVMEIKPNIETVYFSGFIGYIVIGYYLSIKKWNNPATATMIGFILFLFGNVITILGYFYFTKNGGNNNIFYDYLSINVIMVAVGMFIMFKNRASTVGTPNRIVKFIGKYSYGIYLVHILVISETAKYGWYVDNFNTAINIILNVVICLTISTIVVFALNKIPVIKKFAG